MVKRTIFMETTSIDPEKTIAAISNVLRQYGVRQIMIDYNDGGEVGSVSFTMQVKDDRIPFRLPADHNPLLEMARRGETKYLKAGDADQARRIAWRMNLRWIEAQMALVDAGMVTADQVFMPYIMVDAKGTTLYQQLAQKGFGHLQLTEGELK